MQISFVGTGHLGLPCALALEHYGQHKVTGYDVSDLPARILAGEAPPPREEGIEELLAVSQIKMAGSVAEVVAESELVFVAIQTPHSPAYGGETPAPEERRDFEYCFLVQGCRDICRAALAQKKHITMVVVSTVLPGTTNRLIRPLLNEYVTLVYSPAFIAMGTTVQNYLNPEFVICGTDSPKAGVDALRQIFVPMHGSDRLIVMDITSAELTKIAYNFYLSQKVVYANYIMEVAHKTGANCDAVIGALSKATDRVISSKYLYGGMGDGGQCHPRDGIAMSWLAHSLSLSYDLTGDLIRARESQTQWLASLAKPYASQTGLQIRILGRAYKPKSNLTGGSPALLLAHYLDYPAQYDPYTDRDLYYPFDAGTPAVYIIATKHPDWESFPFARGSLVVDPHRYISDRDGVTVLPVGSTHWELKCSAK